MRQVSAKVGRILTHFPHYRRYSPLPAKRPFPKVLIDLKDRVETIQLLITELK